MSTNVEFAVRMNDKSEADAVIKALKSMSGVQNIDMNVDSGVLLVESSLPISVIQEKIESIGPRAVIKGYGTKSLSSSLQDHNMMPTAAVAILGGECGFGLDSVKGVVRFIQLDEKRCVIDGTIDGLSPGLHGLHVHQFGDISNGCNKIGGHFSLKNSPHGARENDESTRHTGDLGNISVTDESRAQFRFVDHLINVNDIIGRTIAVTENSDDLGKGNNSRSSIDGNSGRSLACGIVARSSGLFENVKKICACDGVSLWDEKDKPLAGPSRATR